MWLISFALWGTIGRELPAKVETKLKSIRHMHRLGQSYNIRDSFLTLRSSLQCLNENWTNSLLWSFDLLWQKFASNFAKHLMREKGLYLVSRSEHQTSLLIVSVIQTRLSILDGRDDPSWTPSVSSISRLQGYGAYSEVSYSFVFFYDFINWTISHCILQ